MDPSKIPSIFFFAFFILILFLLYLMAQPILNALIFGAIVSGCFYPFFLRFLRWSKWSREKVSVVACLVIAVMTFLPTLYLSIQLSKETYSLYQFLKSEITEETLRTFIAENPSSQQAIALLKDMGVEFNIGWLKTQIGHFAQGVSAYVLKAINSWVANFFDFLFNFLIMVLVMFAIFSEGHRLKAYILKLLPLPDDQEELIIKTFNQMNYVTLVCNGVGGVIQGVLAGVGFWIAGIPSTTFWSFSMIFLAFIPLLGMSIVYIPACLYLYMLGHTGSALVLFTYCTVIALFVENWFKPKFIGDRIKINSLFVLFCIIGGMGVFGMAGIFYGPLIGIIFLTTVEIYLDHYAPRPRVDGAR